MPQKKIVAVVATCARKAGAPGCDPRRLHSAASFNIDQVMDQIGRAASQMKN